MTTETVENIVQEITIRGSAERIFEALTKPEQVVSWFGIGGKFQVTEAKCDLQPGGYWGFFVVMGNGTNKTISGRYVEIDRPHLLVYTWDEQQGGPETLVRWDLEEKDGVTRARVTHSGFTNEADRTRNNGWPAVAGLLQSYVEGAG